MKARRYSQPFQWQIRGPESGQMSEIELHGSLDESAELDTLETEITGPVCFNAEGITWVNSMGAGKLFRFMQSIARRGPHRLIRGSPSFVRAVNMLPVLARFCEIDSVMAGFVCTQCEHEHHLEVVSQSVRVELPEPECPECGGAMKIDENLETYFRFMRFRK